MMWNIVRGKKRSQEKDKDIGKERMVIKSWPTELGQATVKPQITAPKPTYAALVKNFCHPPQQNSVHTTANENFFQEHKMEENKRDKGNKVESQEMILQQYVKA